MAYGDHDKPTVPQLYISGLIASLFSYFGILVLVSLSMAIDGGGPVLALTSFLFGGIYMLLPAAGIAFLITAPLGCIVGLMLVYWLPPTRWLGAITGALVTIIVLIAWAIVFGGFSWPFTDPGALFFLGGVTAICAFSGWLAQRKVLDWPRPPDETGVFE